MKDDNYRLEKETYANAVKSVPDELKERDNWIVIDSSKEPFEPRKWSREDDRMSFDAAVSVLLQKKGGRYLAYLFTDDDKYCGIDLDNVRDPTTEELTREAWSEIIEPLGSYTELSTSGTGYHVICEGKKQEDRNESAQLKEDGPLVEPPSIEIYDSGQYFLMTGQVQENYDNITTGGEPLHKLQSKYLSARNTQDTNRKSFKNESKTVKANAETIRRTLEEYSKAGHSKAKCTLQYWDSQPESTMGHPSPSEADLAFASNLAFWCRCDRRLIAECFRASNRYRRDFDSDKRGKSGMTYGETTIEKAIKTVYDTFSGHYVSTD
jgi:putative DNA primase/helicase